MALVRADVLRRPFCDVLHGATGHPARSWPPENVHLNIVFASLNTAVLVSSSLTCQLGVFAAERGDVKGLRKWFGITYLMGAFFVAGQVFEYTELAHEGLSLEL